MSLDVQIPGLALSRHTILHPKYLSHKPLVCFRRPLLGLSLVSFPLAAARAQDAGPAIRPGDVVAGAAAGAVYVIPTLFGINEGPADCGPCPRDGVPFFDRWAIGTGSAGARTLSTVALFALAGATWWDIERNSGMGEELVASLEAVAWAAAATELLKAVADRNRPVLYTEGAPGEIARLTNQRSLPSGHVSSAFALATSYILTRGRLYGEPALTGRNLAAVATATLVGILRVVGGRHFPSDVVAGAALGAASAMIVHKIKF